jgi:hypothetical protein
MVKNKAGTKRRTIVNNCVISGIVAALASISVANAEFIVVNNPVVDTVGFYSDAYDSKGAYSYAQSGAQRFELEDSYTTSSLRWWGSMNGFNEQGLSNIDSFQFIVWGPGFQTQVTNQKIDLENITTIATGETNFFGQPIYEFYVPISFQINAGFYYMNIGAQLNDSSGDQFVWSEGQDDDHFWFTDVNGQYKWGDWRPLPSFIGNTAGGAFVLSAPSPGAIALLGMAGLMGRRRR